jgi:transposase
MVQDSSQATLSSLEVRPPRRSFSEEYKRRIVTEYDQGATPETRGLLLRREGLYAGQVSRWRRALQKNKLGKKRGRKGTDPLVKELEALRCENESLKDQLDTAEDIIGAQGKVLALLQEKSTKSATKRS